MYSDEVRREFARLRALNRPMDLEIQRAINHINGVGREMRLETERAMEAIEALRPQASAIRDTVEQLAKGPVAQAMRDIERLRSSFKV